MAMHPRSNGLTEQMVGTIADVTAKIMSAKSVWWDDQVALAAWTYNHTPSESTGVTPYQLLFKREPSNIGDSAVEQ